MIPNRTKSLENVYDLAYSPLNSAKLSCSSEVILCFINAVMPTAKKLPRSGLLIFDPSETLYVRPPTKPVNNKVLVVCLSSNNTKVYLKSGADLELLLANI